VRATFDLETMKLIQLFEKITRAKSKDCINGERILFIVQPTQLGKAIGKKASNIKKLERLLKKKIRIVEFNPNPITFVKNMIAPLKAEVNQENEEIIITGQDTKTKAFIIGRDKQNLKFLNSVVKRFFNIKDIKVV
jgi:N utilization substance protein A